MYTRFVFTCIFLSVNFMLRAQPALAWANHAGAPAMSSLATAIVTDTAQNVIVLGNFSGTADFDPGPGTALLSSSGLKDIFVAKYDANGNYLWAKKFGAGNDDLAGGVVVDLSGAVYFTGFFQYSVDLDAGPGVAMEYADGVYDILFAKYDAAGNYVWGKKIGSAQDEHSSGIALDQNGNVFLCGVFQDTLDTDPGTGVNNLVATSPLDLFISKYDPSGNFVWADAIRGTADYRLIHEIKTDAAGNVFVCGSFMDTTDFDPGAGTANLVSAGWDDAFFAKYDNAGNYLWARAIGGSAPIDMVCSLDFDPAGNIICTGYFGDVADFDPGPGTYLLASAGAEDAFFAKYDAAGNFAWAKRMGNSGDDRVYSVKISATSDIYISGMFYDAVDFDPGSSQAILAAIGDYDAYYAKYDMDGNYLWAEQIGSHATDEAFALTLDAQENIYVAGYFRGTADFAPGATVYNLALTGAADLFFAKYGEGTAGISAPEMNAELEIYPNPSAGLFTVAVPPLWSDAQLHIFDATGALIREMNLQGTTQPIDLSEYASGIYFIRVSEGGSSFSRKVIINR